MLKLSAALSAAGRLSLAAVATAIFLGATPAEAEWNQPWKDEERALVIDAYEFNPINWKELTADERIAGFISKASDGMPPSWSCRGLDGDDRRLCLNRWWKYSVTQELYFTRREMAKMLGLEWGAYHLGRPGNPREQADHFIEFAKPEPDELIAIDIEDNDPEKWMSLAEAEIFADQIFIRLGRYPVLYTNGSTADYISRNAKKYPLLSRLPLWYARYRSDITGMFPEETWPSYALWQFASMHNCSRTSCPYRVNGTKTDIDVNVSPLTVAELREAWPFDDLIGDAPAPRIAPEGEALIADAAPAGDADDARSMMLAAYGPSETRSRPLDPLQLLTEAAREKHVAAERSPVLSSLTASAQRVEPDMPADTVVWRAEPLRTHDVAAGMMDAVGQLKGEMDKVRSVLRPEAPEAHGPRPSVAESAGELAEATDSASVARSRIARQLRDAAEDGLLVPAAGEEDRAPQGERHSSLPDEGAGAWSRLSHRVAAAFSVTR